MLEQGVRCLVVNPADVPTGDKEKRRKSDQVDSRKLARALRSQQLRGIYLPPVAQQEERSLLRTRASLVKDLTRSKNRIKSFLNCHGIEWPACYHRPGAWPRSFVTWLEEIRMSTPGGEQSLSLLVTDFQQRRTLLLEATRRIQELSRSTDYDWRVECLRSIPGIGTLTAMILLTEIGDIRRFHNLDALGAYVGIVPDRHSSGEREVSRGITVRHNPMLRKALVESAHITVRKDPALMQCYNRYCRRMHPNKAIVHIMRKLLNRVRWVLVHEQPYRLSQVG